MKWRVVTPPAQEPISLEDAYRHLNIIPEVDSSGPHSDDDVIISAYISAARDYCEQYMERAIAQQVIEFALDSFPSTGAIKLPMSPTQSIDSVVYIDTDGNEQAVNGNDYLIDNFSEPNWLLPVAGVTWPKTSGAVNSVRIRCLVGYTYPADTANDMPLPPSINAAMLLVLGHFYENRHQVSELKLADLPLGVDRLLKPYEIRLSLA